ncbi:hypothetical protein D3C87_1679520 [compost metagenome]
MDRKEIKYWMVMITTCIIWKARAINMQMWRNAIDRPQIRATAKCTVPHVAEPRATAHVCLLFTYKMVPSLG